MQKSSKQQGSQCETYNFRNKPLIVNVMWGPYDNGFGWRGYLENDAPNL